MSTQVTPPYSVTKARPIDQFSAAQNNYLRQLENLLNQLYLRTGGPLDSVAEDNAGIDLSARLAHIEEITPSADLLTWDDTGFTWDQTDISLDETLA